jgi:hypothetical protein
MKTGWKREVVRFDRPCFSKMPDQAAILIAQNPATDIITTDEELKISGQRDQVDLAV